MRDARALSVAKTLIAVAAAAALGGCFHVPLRARENGRELGYGTESSVIYGQHSAASTRRMQSALRSSAMGWQAAQPFSPFGDWSW
ncbi:MAG TPA: hypothetical protein VGH98_06760 [Gemmatimonadaceae bacterium]|jgi:hypothetical protein